MGKAEKKEDRVSAAVVVRLNRLRTPEITRFWQKLLDIVAYTGSMIIGSV